MAPRLEGESRRLLTAFSANLNRLDPQPLDWQRFYDFILYAFGHEPHLRRSLTWDRGKEMGEHVRFTLDTGVQVYFCDPRGRVAFDDTETKLSAAIDRFTGPPAPPRLR